MLIGKPIAQLMPKAGVLSVIYKPVIVNPLSIASLFAANTGDDDTTFSISLARQGAADSPEQYLYSGVPLVGEIAFNSNVIVTAISTINTWTKVNIASFLTTSLLFDSPSNFTLRYIGTAGGTGLCQCTVSMKSGGATDVVSAVLVKNATVNGAGEYLTGTILTAGIITEKFGGAGDVRSGTIHVTTALTTNDTLNLFVRNNEDNDDVTVTDANLTALIP